MAHAIAPNPFVSAFVFTAEIIGLHQYTKHKWVVIFDTCEFEVLFSSFNVFQDSLFSVMIDLILKYLNLKGFSF